MHVQATRPSKASVLNLPATRRWIILSAVFFLPSYIAVRIAAIADPDIYWHVSTARWIFLNHALPHSDPFSLAPVPWVAYSWLFDLLAGYCFRIFGVAGAFVLTSGLTLLVTVSIWSLIRHVQPDFLKSTFLTLLATLALAQLYTPRPWLVSILLFTIQLRLLSSYHDDRNWRHLLWLAPLYVLAANVHVQFVYSLAALAPAAIVSSVASTLEARYTFFTHSKAPARPLWLFLGTCFAVTFVNPYGWNLYGVIAKYAVGRAELSYIQDMQPMSFRDPLHYLILALVLFAFFTVGRTRAPDLFLTALLILSCYFGFRSIRDVWFPVITSAIIIGSSVSTRAPQVHLFSRLQVGAAVLAAAFFVLAAPRTKDLRVPTLQAQASVCPVAAVDYIRQHHLEGPMFNHIDWGGYLIYSLPTLPVQIDGRTNVHSGQRISRSLATWNLEPGWDTDPELVRANLIIGPRQLALSQHLLSDSRFQIVYQDKLASVFVRR